jgi:serine/threonine protein kinase
MANATPLTVVRDQARPRKLGRYELEECLGVDAGIETYRARVRGLAGFDRIFAVKCYRPGRGSALSLNDPTICVAKRAAALSDARIARVLDADVIDGVAIVVTEFVHGLDLDRFREWAQSSGVLGTGADESAQKWQKIVAYIGAEIASALALIHGLTPPLVHGGLGPRNVIATARGGIKLLDIGGRRSVQPPEGESAARASSYAAPDEWAAEPRSKGDVRALGAVLFELATGEPPPAGMGSFAARKILTALWPSMADFLASLLAEDPELRPSANEAAKILGDFWSDVPDASMVAEMAALVRNFSAFVSDGASPQTPSPVSVEAPLLLAPATAASAEAKPISTSGGFTAMPDDPTRMASSSYADALFEALAASPAMPTAQAMPTLAPEAIHAPVEAMAAEIEAADLVSSLALDGLPPPPPGDEPIAPASEDVVAEEIAPVASSPVATTIDSVPIPEAAQWGAQALAALGSQAGVEISSLQPQVPPADLVVAREVESREVESREAESGEAESGEAEPNELPPPVSDPAIEEAFAAAEAFKEALSPPVPPPQPEVDVTSAARGGDGKHTLLFAPTASAAANLEDELIDERIESESDVAQVVAEAFETAEPEPLAAHPFAASSSDALPADVFDLPPEPALVFQREPSVESVSAAAEQDPPPAATALTTGEADSAAGWALPRLAHAMSASGEQIRQPTTRTAKKSAADMQAETADILQAAGSSRRRKIGFAVVSVVALAGAAAAVMLLRPPLLRHTPLSKLGKRTPSAAITQTPAQPSAATKTSPHAAPAVALQSSVKSGMVTVPIASKPDGAMVWIDGEERGRTPCAVKLSPGSARVTLVRAGFRTSQSTVDVSDGATVDVTLVAATPPTSGEARFRAECSTQGKLPIVVDGRETGALCPFSKLRVDPGSHTIGLFNPASGTIHSKEITLSAGVRSINFGD